MNTKYSSMKESLHSFVEAAQQALASHKQLEVDLGKVETWVKEADVACAKPIQVDCSLDMLNSQVKKYRTLYNAGKVQDELLKEASEKAGKILPHLTDADQIALKDNLQELRENVNRINHCVHTRLTELEESCSAKGKLELEMRQVNDLLSMAQEDLRVLNKGVGYKHEDATAMLTKLQGVQDNLSDVQPLLTQVQHSCDQLKALCQPGPSEELEALRTLHEDLKESANNTKNKLDQAIHLRELYYMHKGDLESCLSQCEQQMEAVNVIGVTVPTRLDRYKVRFGLFIGEIYLDVFPLF